MTTAQLLTADQAAELMGYSKSHLYRLVRQGIVPARRVGRTVRFIPSELTAWVDALPKAGN